jgi:hypothetical protein
MPKAGVLAWIFQVLREFSDIQVYEQVGMDGYVALRFLTMMARLGGAVSFLALAILVPVYATGNNNAISGDNVTKIEGISLCTMANLPKSGNRLWASCLFNYVFTFLFIYSLYNEYDNFAKKRQVFLQAGAGLRGYSVLMENIPKQHSSPETLTQLIEQNFPGEVVATSVAVACPYLSKLLAERLKICTQLENATGTLSVKNERPMIQLGCCGLVGEKVDAVSHWEQELAKINGLVSEQQEQATMERSKGVSLDRSSGTGVLTGPSKPSMTPGLPVVSTTAFVTMSSRKTRDAMLATPILYSNFRGIRVMPAPAPGTVLTVYATAVLTVYATAVLTVYATTVLTVYATAVLTVYATAVLTVYTGTVLTVYATVVLTAYTGTVLTVYATAILTVYATAVLTVYTGNVLTGTAPAPEDIIWCNVPTTPSVQQRGITATSLMLTAGVYSGCCSTIRRMIYTSGCPAVVSVHWWDIHRLLPVTFHTWIMSTNAIRWILSVVSYPLDRIHQVFCSGE